LSLSDFFNSLAASSLERVSVTRTTEDATETCSNEEK
ncbi:putative pinn, partial [Schistosoma mansoni]